MATARTVSIGLAPPAMSLIDPATTPGVQPDGQTGWTLSMSEEFTGSLTVTDAGLGYVTFRPTGYEWSTRYPDWPRFTSQSPGGSHTNTDQSAYYDTSKVSLSSGSLILACDKQTTVSGLPYTAGMVQTLPSFDQLYGFFEARIRINTQADTGHWPAWWTHVSTYNQWPPEIDIWEYYGAATQVEQNVFMLDGSKTLLKAYATQTAWHTYGCKWDSGSVTWYIDGTQVNRTTSTVPADPLFLILNNGSRAPASPTFTSNPMSVDYVRAWA